MSAISRKEEVLAMTVADFAANYEISSQTRNNLASNGKKNADEGWSNGHYSSTYHSKLKDLATTVTMSDALTKFESFSPKLVNALVASGLTCLDVPSLPQTITSSRELRGLSKENLLAMDARRLGTLSSAALRAYWSGYGKMPLITIGEVLASNPWEGEQSYEVRHCRQGLLNTRRLLVELGFKYEDGPFMQHGTRRQFVEKLIAKDSLGKKQAAKVADLAMKYRWIPKFTE